MKNEKHMMKINDHENICDITCELILDLRRPIRMRHVDLVGGLRDSQAVLLGRINT